MASRQQIKQRIGSVKNTKQITRAMQLVSASKLRRAQEAAVGPTAYASLAREILTRLRQLAADESELKLFTERPVKHRLLIVITSDLGLAGAYDGNVIRRMLQEVQVDRQKGIKTSVICIGRKAAQAASHVVGLNVLGAYQEFPDRPDIDQLRPVITSTVGMFANSEADAVDMIFTHFISTVSQQVEAQRLLPAGFQEAKMSDELARAEIEPSAETLLRAAAMQLLESQVYQAFLDAIASEHSMRMLAMKSATDNATDLIEDLTLAFNNARQAAITQELAEISAGVEAMK
ncbi:MAG TPA: ATP synthase F1 subunit gamma [Candidatus Saccharimonadales bacterium]|nr:ATP synthase F1 subunit gamma [Candidatus Saccharimonadales bacterium]